MILDQLGHLDCRVHKDKEETGDYLELQAMMVVMVWMVREDQLVPLVPVARMASRVSLDEQERRELWVALAKMETMDSLVPRVNLVLMELWEPLDLLGQQVPLETLVNLVHLVQQVYRVLLEL